MLIADCLITDYSSTLTDFAILERPIFLFAYDYEEYFRTRGLYMRLEDLLPGYVCRSEEELIEHIENCNITQAIKDIKSLKDRYVCGGGESTKVCINRLKELIENNTNHRK